MKSKTKKLNLEKGFYKLILKDSQHVIEVLKIVKGDGKKSVCEMVHCKKIKSCIATKYQDHIELSMKKRKTYYYIKHYGALGQQTFWMSDRCFLSDDFVENKELKFERSIEPIQEAEVAVYLLQTGK
jgi:hypothetical protein